MDAAKEFKRKEEAKRAAELAAQKGRQMRRILVSQLYSAEKVERAFDRDWSTLCHPILQPLDK